MRFDLRVPAPEEMSRDELIVVVHCQVAQITAQAGQLAELMEANEALAGKLARLEHLLSRNSGNSSSPPSKDDDPGRTPPPPKGRGGGAKRSKGKQPGAPGSHLAWTDTPDDLRDRFPQGQCGCGADLGGARDLGVVDRYQQHEIPQVSVQVIQYDAHQVQCGCGAVHTAAGQGCRGCSECQDGRAPAPASSKASPDGEDVVVVRIQDVGSVVGDLFQ
ncbi:MAG: DUF6444 domain-containing protein [Pseudonocardiaceae bacterium]